MRTVLPFVFAMVALLVASPAFAQSPGGAEARLKEKNITLPAEGTPAANFVNSVQVGNLLFLAGNTPGAQWTPNGKLGKDLTVEQGYAAARQAGLDYVGKVRGALAALTASNAS